MKPGQLSVSRFFQISSSVQPNSLRSSHVPVTDSIVIHDSTTLRRCTAVARSTPCRSGEYFSGVSQTNKLLLSVLLSLFITLPFLLLPEQSKLIQFDTFCNGSVTFTSTSPPVESSIIATVRSKSKLVILLFFLFIFFVFFTLTYFRFTLVRLNSFSGEKPPEF
ncbi:hypothetical protein HanPI659440_Chr07g0273121 [Helianthus annuus]|nr:hypothetical protein HanIR_Chr07g0331371 [Helianthus annuus]KAJ0771793.1 hypothetical protein HanPI659440_Chr07g0273121 [Helianthus annuus]